MSAFVTFKKIHINRRYLSQNQKEELVYIVKKPIIDANFLQYTEKNQLFKRTIDIFLSLVNKIFK